MESRLFDCHTCGYRIEDCRCAQRAAVACFLIAAVILLCLVSGL
jgi:hypothetical protein